MAEMRELPFQTEQDIYTVSQLNETARDILELNFSDIWLEGEISNYKLYPSGHHYFTLKDDKSEIRAVLFAGAALGLNFAPGDGQQVLVQGSLTVYHTRGQYQIIIESMKPAGQGKLQLAFEKLKAKLRDEGLFDPAHKQPLPDYPDRIAIVTSAQGAAVRDIISIISRRYPSMDVLLFPVAVQGAGSENEIANAIRQCNTFSTQNLPIDIIIAGRGGGSLEDLWAFNEEVVARAIFDSEIPVVSAVGHEIDFTIADFVADLRAPTPSAAAEIITPDSKEILGFALESVRSMLGLNLERMNNVDVKLRLITTSYAFRRPVQHLQDMNQRLDHIGDALIRSFTAKQTSTRERITSTLAQLDSINPLAVMKRGFSVASDQSGMSIRSIQNVTLNDKINLKLEDGSLLCEVLEKLERN